MKKATLALILRDDEILLGRKQGMPEIGEGTLNGPGGKLVPGETLLDCLVREVQEEIAIDISPTNAEKTAIITFFGGDDPNFEVHVYRVTSWAGEPCETGSMAPGWYRIDTIPFERMLESDRAWFSRAVSGEKFNAIVRYREKAKGFIGIEFQPFVDHD